MILSRLSITGKKKITLFIVGPVILLVSAISAWRMLAIISFGGSGPAWLAAWLGLTCGFGLFWLAALTALNRFSNQATRQLQVTALLGAVSLGLLGLLGTTPAGLSRLTLELYAENVWSPRIFNLTWVKDGIWETPISLPQTGPRPVSLEIIAGTPAQIASVSATVTPASPGEVWFVQASQADGQLLPLADFQPDSGWQQRQVDWGSYSNQTVWVAQQPPDGQPPAVLRWQGQLSGPPTLLFARHDRAGQVTLRWNGQEQTLDLAAPTTEFAGVTLPLAGPVFWQARLPLSASQAEEIGLTIEPDPGGGYVTRLNQLKLTGLPGQPVEFNGAELLAAIQVKYGRAELTPTGLQVVADDPRRPPQLFVVKPLAPSSLWSYLLPPLENGLLILYLAVLGYLGLGSLARRLPAPMLTHFNLAAGSILLALLIGEAGLRFYLPPAGKYYVWPPYLHEIFHPNPKLLPGVAGEAHFIINSQGIRGDEFSAGDDYRVLAIGGSTTECLYLDQAEAWPQLLQTKLNDPAAATGPTRQVWVGNIGRGGRGVREHVLQMKYLLPQYPELDAVILLAGINDLSASLRWGDDNPYALTTLGSSQAVLERAFSVLIGQDPDAPYYEQTATWRAAGRIWRAQAQALAAEAIDVDDETGQNYISRRERRQRATLRDELPDLAPGLAEYSRNIQTIIDLAEAQQVRLILLTQPALYRPDLTPAEENLLWFGQGPGHDYFYSSRVMAEALALYNQTVLDICRQRQVECLDLAELLPRDTTIFYDDVHFTEQGARQVAGVMADYLLSRPPFKILD